MFIEGSGKEETVLMSLTGDFDLNELSVLTDKMNLPGGDDLKKASKNNTIKCPSTKFSKPPKMFKMGITSSLILNILYR
jgi:hypothetical protein